jgi:hypothetical protein
MWESSRKILPCFAQKMADVTMAKAKHTFW